jgi:hypothetical protein
VLPDEVARKAELALELVSPLIRQHLRGHHNRDAKAVAVISMQALDRGQSHHGLARPGRRLDNSTLPSLRPLPKCCSLPSFQLESEGPGLPKR